MKPFKSILVVFIVAVACYILCYLWLDRTGTTDLYHRVCAARGLLDGKDPFTACPYEYRDQVSAEYPLTTILFFTPVARLPYYHAIALFWAFSNALLAYGIIKNKARRLWLIFLSGPYWITFAWQQFSVLMAAVMLLPGLLPLTLLKPQHGLPVFLTNFTWKRAAATAVFLGLTFMIDPTWPFKWWSVSRHYDGLIPLLVLPLGPLMLLALFRWREKEARYLFLMACVPQRLLYDTTTLLLLPKNLRQMLFMCILSWIPAIAWMTEIAPWPEDTVHFTLAFLMVPLLAMQLAPEISRLYADRRKKRGHPKSSFRDSLTGK